VTVRYPPRVDTAATAAELWAARGNHPIDPARAQVLKSSKKCTVLRFPAVDSHQGNVIVKVRRTAEVAAELAFYEQVAPRLPVGLPAMYLSLQVGTDTWMFMEDAGVAEYRRDRPEHVRSMTSWLATVHRIAADTPASSLPPRTALHFLGHLESARAAISASLDEHARGADDRRVLVEFRSLLDRVRTAWNDVVRICERGPTTLVHGDLAAKNIRIVQRPGAPGVRVLDWETAGWGWAAPDLAAGSVGWGIDLDQYRIEVGGFVEGWTDRDIRSYAAIGTVLRYLAAADWAARSLPYPRSKRAVPYLRSYAVSLEHALADGVSHEPTGSLT
jgi:aminoglycoside phosphotransferase (APT) family kinase protein